MLNANVLKPVPVSHARPFIWPSESRQTARRPGASLVASLKRTPIRSRPNHDSAITTSASASPQAGTPPPRRSPRPARTRPPANASSAPREVVAMSAAAAAAAGSVA